jgi:two-component system sensor histidine kinase PilS (NtrC family)
MADMIVHQSKRMNTIIESVMQISRREPPKPEYLLLARWLEDFSRGYLKSLNRHAELTIECEYRELLVEFDQENLQRVMSNLLDNALRHSKLATGLEQASIKVGQDFTSLRCLVSIIDAGEGVPLADRAKLFEPFFTTVAEGSGMGLYLCKELCEINNATLSYLPTDNGESSFCIAMSQRAR